MNPHPLQIVQVPSWSQLSWLRHGFSTRPGGVSTVYGDPSLNLGWTKEDSPEAVRENRSLFVNAVTGDPVFTLVTVRQIHSSRTHILRAADAPRSGRLATPEGKAVLEADGLMTDLPNVLLAVGTADCVPVLVIDPRKKAVAAFHAGWRGTAARIVEQGIRTMREEYGSHPADLHAAVGPSIGPCCYTVGEEVRQQFAAGFPYAETLFRAENPPTGDRRLFLDLWQANHSQLLDAGLDPEKISILGQCTACSRNPGGSRRFFSHRDEHGNTGRMLNAIGIAG